jgi:hypothetical protein
MMEAGGIDPINGAGGTPGGNSAIAAGSGGVSKGETGAAIGSGVRQVCSQRSHRTLRLRPASAASGTSYSVEHFGHRRRILLAGMAFLGKPRNDCSVLQQIKLKIAALAACRHPLARGREASVKQR